MFTLDGTISLAFRFFYNGEEIALRDSPLAEEEVWVKREVSESAKERNKKTYRKPYTLGDGPHALIDDVFKPDTLCRIRGQVQVEGTATPVESEWSVNIEITSLSYSAIFLCPLVSVSSISLYFRSKFPPISL